MPEPSSELADELREAIFQAAAQPSMSRNPLDVLLELQEAVIAYEQAGKHTLGLWNLLRNKGAINCTYGYFTRSLARFRERFGLPSPRRRTAVRLERGGGARLGEPVGRIAPCQPSETLLPPPAPRRRAPVSTVPIPQKTVGALHSVSVQKMWEANADSESQ
jgi:hypothetical protein